MKLSIVDLSVVLPGETRHDALRHSIETAIHIEKLGFHRIWLAEHHGARSIAGRAPEVLMAAVAAATSRIRVGSGSVLLNHYSPFKVAEIFCTLNELYPGRIDLGAGRATTGPVLDMALQQDRSQRAPNRSDEQIRELVSWLENGFLDDHPFSSTPIHSLPEPPDLYLLGSSGWSASAAAALGLRYVFAGFINQQGTPGIIDSYRSAFRPSDGPTGIMQPEVILALHAVCADTEEEARRQLAPVVLMYRYLQKGILDVDMRSPDEAIAELGYLPETEPYVPGSGIPPRFIGGTPAQVHAQLTQLGRDLDIQEFMIQDLITEHRARLRSYELFADVFGLEKNQLTLK